MTADTITLPPNEHDRLLAARAVAALQRIADIEPHPVGATANEYHMRKIAQEALVSLRAGRAA